MIANELFEWFLEDSIRKRIVVTFDSDESTITNTELFEEKFTLEENLCSEPMLKFGCIEASKLTFTTRENLSQYVGSTIRVAIQLLVNGNWLSMRLLTGFRIASVEPDGSRTEFTVTAYDKLYDIITMNVSDWYNRTLPNMTSQLTLKQFRNSFFTYIGITQVGTTLVNDNMMVKKTLYNADLSGKDILTAILEINGCFGHINRNGYFQYINLYKSSHDFEIQKNAFINCEYADYTTDKINRLIIRQTEDDLGVTVGTGDNIYTIQDNFLVYGYLQEDLEVVANNIFNNIKNITYTPLKTLTLKGNADLEVGDYLRVRGQNGTFRTYILQRTMSGIQALRDTFSANGAKTFPQTKTGVSSVIQQLRGRTNEIKHTLSENSFKITNLEEGLKSSIEQLENRITLEVSKIQEEIDGEIATYNVSANPTLKNYPAWDFTYSIPCNGTLKCDDLRFVYSQESYAKNARSVAFNTKTHQAFRFTEDETKTQLDLRWSWQPIADSEYGYILEQLASIQIDLDGITLDVKRVEQNAVTTTTFESRIKQLANSITLDVDEQIKELDGEITSLKGELKIQSDKISATVTKTGGDGKNSFGWELTDTQWSLIANGSTVFRCNKDGAWISGYTKTETLQANYATIKKLDAEIVTVKDLIAEKADITELNARIATVNSLVATKASISQLNVSNARIENIEADYIKTKELDATNARIKNIESDYIKTKDLEAVDAKFQNLNASNITSGTLKITDKLKIEGTIEGNENLVIKGVKAEHITGGFISASHISSDIMRVKDLTFDKLTSTLNNAQQGTISVGKIQTSAYVYYLGEEGYKQLSLQRVNIGGREYRLLGLS